MEGSNININKEASEHSEINKYVIIRIVQMICIGAFVFGALWEGTIRFNMTTPQFLMVYGGTGAILSEILARFFKRYEKKNLKK
jgi:hypothetical protein